MEGGVAPFLREGATICLAWDGAAGTMLLSIDGGPFKAPDVAVRPNGVAGARLYPVINGHSGCVVEFSLRGELGLATPSPDYRPFDHVLIPTPLLHSFRPAHAEDTQ